MDQREASASSVSMYFLICGASSAFGSRLRYCLKLSFASRSFPCTICAIPAPRAAGASAGSAAKAERNATSASAGGPRRSAPPPDPRLPPLAILERDEEDERPERAGQGRATPGEPQGRAWARLLANRRLRHPKGSDPPQLLEVLARSRLPLDARIRPLFGGGQRGDQLELLPLDLLDGGLDAGPPRRASLLFWGSRGRGQLPGPERVERSEKQLFQIRRRPRDDRLQRFAHLVEGRIP